MAAEERCAYGDIECFGMVVLVFGGGVGRGGGGEGLFHSRQKHKARRCHKYSQQ